jgi:hypothetical protein
VYPRGAMTISEVLYLAPIHMQETQVWQVQLRHGPDGMWTVIFTGAHRCSK